MSAPPGTRQDSRQVLRKSPRSILGNRSRESGLFGSIEIILCGPNFLVFVILQQTSWLDLLHSAPWVWTATAPPAVFLPALNPALELEALLCPLLHFWALRPGLPLDQPGEMRICGRCCIYTGGEKMLSIHTVWFWTWSFKKRYLGFLYHSLTLEMWDPSHAFTAFFQESTEGICILSWALEG